MSNDSLFRRAWAQGVLAGALVLGLAACSLEEVELPDFDGPSTLGQGLRVTATPDIVLADGLSTALVQAILIDQDGRPAANQQVFFTIADAQGRVADIGKLRSTGPDLSVGTGLVVRTGADGVARVVYVAPPRTDFTASSTVIVAARRVQDDANGALYRYARIELRSAEPRFFPPDPAGLAPSCGFAVEPGAGPYRVNRVVAFQNRSFDVDGVIVRYEWFFGDGSPVDYAPDTAHVFRVPGTFTVTLVVTDNTGRQAACSAVLTVIP